LRFAALQEVLGSDHDTISDVDRVFDDQNHGAVILDDLRQDFTPCHLDAVRCFATWSLVPTLEAESDSVAAIEWPPAELPHCVDRHGRAVSCAS
jgi:hypothetical protein